jgi:glycosyltransferase involved in cell wall biosynthesis
VTDDVDIDDLDVALAHWHVNAWGGAEYLVTKMAEALGINMVYTLGEPDPSDPNPYSDIPFVDVTPSLDYSRIRRLQQHAGRVFEYAQWEDVDWREFGDPDVLVTSGATTRAVITPDDTLHVNYCHSPPRWFYDLYHDRKSSMMGILSRSLVRYLRMRDATLDSRVDHYFVNSPIIERRLWKFYKRESEVLYPPVELDKYRNDGDEGYYLHLGRLDEEKGVPAVVEAFSELDKRLVLAGGTGDIDDSVRQQINNVGNIEYRGFVSKEEKLDLLANCTAVVFNGRNEDFGIVPIEANASGKPVLARDEGFLKIFVEQDINGLPHDGSPEAIRRAVRSVSNGEAMAVVTELDQFRFETFEAKLIDRVASAYYEYIDQL